MWSWFKDLIFAAIEALEGLVGDWGLAIIIATLIFRLILAPIMHSQGKSNYKMQKIQPQIQEIQTRFADDPVRMNEEIQKMYAETKFNPMAGCLPMLLQLPIFMAMFQTLREIGTSHPDISYSFYSLVPDLTKTPSSAFSEGIGAFIPYLILMLIFALATFLPMFIQNLKTESSQRTMMLVMSVVMTAMMLWISWASPAGVLLFWGVSSLIGILQNWMTKTMMKKEDEKLEAERAKVAPVKVDVVRKERKPRPKKKH